MLLSVTFPAPYMSLSRVYRKRGLTLRATRVWLATTTASFLLATMDWICFLLVYASQIKGLFIDSGGMVNHATFVRLDNRVAPKLILQNWAYTLLIIIGDGVLVWRTWVICPEQ
ncbi:hypothetical protein FPV67DRAFT_1544408 [Lyophyllum atratum]|nr:hypothetical protein FPV67DRAFT_1544408 [Lyophyllum atratum]